jgi:glycerol-3-phosphate responsive antiterminator
LTTSRTASDLRAEYEKAYSERMLCIQKFYEMKYETLHDAIQQVYKTVLHDELLKTLKKDATTAEFIDRVAELFDDVVSNEREILIERLGQQLTELRY